MFGPCVLNEIWITNLSSALIGMLMSLSKLFLFSKEVHFISGVRLLLELYYAVVIKHVAFFTILAKLTVVFTCNSLPLNLYTSIFGCGCGFGFEQKFWRIDGFGEKKARIGGFAYPYSPPSNILIQNTICKLVHLIATVTSTLSQPQKNCRSSLPWTINDQRM